MDALHVRFLTSMYVQVVLMVNLEQQEHVNCALQPALLAHQHQQHV